MKKVIFSLFIAVMDIFPNLAAGILLHRRKQLKVGSKIKFKRTNGTVTELSLLDTKIKTNEGNIISIPNSAFSKSEITGI